MVGYPSLASAYKQGVPQPGGSLFFRLPQWPLNVDYLSTVCAKNNSCRKVMTFGTTGLPLFLLMDDLTTVGPTLPSVMSPVQLMRSGIGQNVSCAVGDFV